MFCRLNLTPQRTYRFKDLYKELIIRIPEKVGSVGSRKALKQAALEDGMGRMCTGCDFTSEVFSHGPC